MSEERPADVARRFRPGHRRCAARPLGALVLLLAPIPIASGQDIRFLPRETLDVASLRLTAAAVDLDGDGDQDLVSAGMHSVACFENDGHGNFVPGQVLPVGFLTRLAVGDIDQDGDLDLAASVYRDQTALVLLRNDAGLLAVDSYHALEGRGNDLVLEDLNGDGGLDVAVARGNSLWGQDSVWILWHQAGFQYRIGPRLPVTRAPFGIAAGDLDGQHGLDLVVVSNPNGVTTVFRSDGAGGYVASTYTGPGSARSVAIGDLDGDGDEDIAVGPNNEHVNVFWNHGRGTFGGPRKYGNGHKACYLKIADMNCDGRLDIVAGQPGGPGGPSYLSVFVNLGGRNFESSTPADTDIDLRGIALGDLDAAPGLDVATAHSNVPSVGVLLGGSCPGSWYELQSNRDQVQAGDLLQLTTVGGMPGGPVVLAIVGVQGLPVYQTVSVGTFDGAGNHIVGGTVPGNPGIDVDFQSYAIDVRANSSASNRVLVQFR